MTGRYANSGGNVHAGTTSGQGAGGEEPPGKLPGWEMLDPDEILRKEFDYAMQSSLQANTDRTQVVSLFLILVGAIGSLSLALMQIPDHERLHLSARQSGIGALLVALVGFFTVMKLVRLREAWFDSVLAMNFIKDYYASCFPWLNQAFHWKTATIPRPDKLWSISFDLVLLVATLDSIAIAGGLALVFPGGLPWIGPAAGIVFLIAQLAMFHLVLRRVHGGSSR